MTSGFNIQILNSLMYIWGVHFTWFDYNDVFWLYSWFLSLKVRTQNHITWREVPLVHHAWAWPNIRVHSLPHHRHHYVIFPSPATFNWKETKLIYMWTRSEKTRSTLIVSLTLKQFQWVPQNQNQTNYMYLPIRQTFKKNKIKVISWLLSTLSWKPL